eukprot:CAMPEP_0181325326 /NCGR_PEP_ID=MMETSP1101-20121128/20858_1 /TAXON_ID=46948 /ORGANISM="Rhodomonas abbreviata, Strain Caron Lab Isolate" /LENGTH=1312 /DNA_ID=CAMNT_0023433611 /DNA_START=118 /DNA_END=4056 /DNA_ORIENTATION=+
MTAVRFCALAAVAFCALHAADATGRFDSPLRMRGGDATAADFGRAQAPMKRQGAFKIARVLSQGFDQIKPADEVKVLEEKIGATMTKKLERIGYKGESATGEEDPFLTAYVNLKLAACGSAPVKTSAKEENFLRLVEPILKSYQEQQHVLSSKGLDLCPADQRIQAFLDSYLEGVDGPVPKLPVRQFKMDRHGLAKMLSLPKGKDKFQNDYISSYRCSQGIVHNPTSDKRTTKGVFHIVDGGLPASADKKLVPKIAFKRILEKALQPPSALHTLPYTADQEKPTEIFATLLLRPLSNPEVPGFMPERTSETRFFVPGSCTSNLDFVESIFGNGDNPDLAENDAALDPEHWTGVTGCVILAPHVLGMNAKELGLPHKSKANERQIKDGMYYEKDDDLYNQGGAFKLSCRDARGVPLTVIADNYFGYCKKEVKTQLGYTANVHGLSEEEHAGGCIAFPAFDLGEVFDATSLGKVSPKGNAAFLGETHKHLSSQKTPTTFKNVVDLLGDTIEMKPEGYAVDKAYPDIFYVPENAVFSMPDQSVTFGDKKINLAPRITYILPSGYKVEMVKKGSNNISTKKGAQSGQYEKWHLKGTVAEGANLHKPATVSGGGKSEISKRLQDMIKFGPVFANDVSDDFDQIEQIFAKDYTKILSGDTKHPFEESGVKTADIKTLLDAKISTGIIIKLLSPFPQYTDEHNAWIRSIPTHIRELALVIKQNYKPEWGDSWRQHFHTDAINGALGHELKYGESPLLSSYIRVGFRSKYDKDIPLKDTTDDHLAWKTFTLRQDFFPCDKLQTEDDITASIVVPRDLIKGLNYKLDGPSYKLSQNVEFRLFQRPDEAIHPGYDKVTELDMSRPGCFIANFEPMNREQIQKIVDDTVGFEKFTEPMQERLMEFLNSATPEYCISSAHPRLVDGKPTANPRYLQDSMEVTDIRAFHVGETGARLARQIPLSDSVPVPVTSVLCGRRNNAPDEKNNVPALAVHNPIHYFELPELFMEFTSSMTGKSPSTTGAGSEGALTKGPFNMISMVHDLNAALVSYAVSGYDTFISSAGVIGPNKPVDHDISLLVPEVWSRMREDERSAKYLIENGYLEKCEPIEHNGKMIPANVLGYRITEAFIKHFFGRVFANPSTVFDADILRPELQNMDIFEAGINTITETNKRVGKAYVEDGSADMAVPPLKALFHIMANGEYEGMTLDDPKFRAMWSREAVMGSDWYKARLSEFQLRESERLKRGLKYLEDYVAQSKTQSDWKGKQIVEDLGLEARIERIQEQLKKVEAPTFLKTLEGTLGVDPAIFACENSNIDKPLSPASRH